MKTNLITITLFTIYVLTSCNLEGVKKDTKTDDVSIFEMLDTTINNSDNLTQNKSAITLKKDTLENGKTNNMVWQATNGLRIEWDIKKESNLINYHDVVLANYSARVARGDVYDSNNKIGFPVPLKTGIGMLVEGWDIALQQMHPGDKGRIMIPSKLAYGKQGVLGKIPQNADIIVDIEIISVIEPLNLLDGVKVYKYETKTNGDYPRKGQKITFDYFAFTKGKEGKLYNNSYEQGKPFTFTFENDNVVEGLHIGFSRLRAGDRAFIEIPSNVAYGNKGYLDFVPPNTDIVFDVRVIAID